MRLSAILTEIRKQTGIAVEDRRDGPDLELTVGFEKVPFWQAIDEVAAKARAIVQVDPGSIVLVNRPDGVRPILSHAGLFRCSVKRVTASRDVDSGKATYLATVEIAWEPQLQPLLLESRAQKCRLVLDKQGAVVLPPEGSAMAPVDGRSSFPIDIALPAIPRTVEQIPELSGHLTAIVPTRMVAFTFERLDTLAQAESGAAVLRQSRDGVGCRLDKIQLLDDRWSIRVSLELPPGGATLESFQTWVVNNEIQLVTADGKRRLNSTGYQLEVSTSRKAVLTYHFTDKAGARGSAGDWSVVYRTAAGIVEVPFDFAFKTIPLP